MPRELTGAGELINGSTVYAVPRAPEVRRLDRLLRLDDLSRGLLLGGMGAVRGPHASLQSFRRGPVAVTARVRVGPPVRPPASQSDIRRLNASWSEFRRLQADPRTRMCVRRRVRKSVLFAKHIAGRRGSAPGPYRRTQDSQWSC